MRMERHSHTGMPPHLSGFGRQTLAMIELLFIAQTLRNPIQALARRWYCRSLFRATRGARRCK